MAKPALKSFAAALYASMTPMQYAEGIYDFPLAKFLAGLGEEFQVTDSYGRDQGDMTGWATLLDPDLCPPEALGWLGQFVGVTIPEGLSEQEQRDFIKARPGWGRGTVETLMKTVQILLTGTKTIVFRERDAAACPSDPPYGLTIITKPSETPVEDWATTNLVANPSFETDLTGWANIGLSSMVSSADTSMFGTKSLKGVVSAANPLAYYTLFTTPAQGNLYSFSGYITANRNVNVNCFWIFRDSGGTTITQGNTGYYTALKAGQWSRVFIDGIPAPAGAAQILLGLQLFAMTVGDIVYFDGAQIERNAKATPYTNTSRPAGLGPVGQALRAQKPAGIILNYLVQEGQDFQSVFANNATFQVVYTKYATFQGLYMGQPGL